MLDKKPRPQDPPVVLTKPPTDKPDWRKLAEKVRKDFPKTLARLGE